ncbi:dynamin family protein, partial [Nostoc sp. UCD122]|nr:dynamin family protein [Nostoc sp. UCD122]
PPRQENTAKTPEKKVEPPKQQVSSPPPKTTPSPNPAELEAKFTNWEMDEEIARMKAKMGSPGFQNSQPPNQNTQAPKSPQSQTEKDKIAHAY